MGMRSMNFLLQTEQQGKKSLEQQALKSVQPDGLERGAFLQQKPLEPIIVRRTTFVMHLRSYPLSPLASRGAQLTPPSQRQSLCWHGQGQGHVHSFGDIISVTVLPN